MMWGADEAGFSALLLAPTLSGSTITSSRYQTRWVVFCSDGRIDLICREQIECAWSRRNSASA